MIVDDQSMTILANLMREKGEASKWLPNIMSLEKSQFGKDVKIIRSDNRTVFTSTAMKTFYAEKGIIYQTSCVDTP